MAKIDLYEKYLNSKKGDLWEYPIDETAIRAFDITEEEIQPFINNPDYANVHWFNILSKIINDRKNS